METKNVILITGGCGNVGKCLIERIKGKAVIICCDISEAIYEFEDEMHGVYAIQCDLSQKESLQGKLIELARKGIELNQAVLTHGKIAYGKLEDIDYMQFQEIIEANLYSCFYAIKDILPYLKKNNGGNIVVMASQFANVAAYDLMAYCTAKAAVKHLVKCIALDYAESGIIINSISPGIMESNMNELICKSYEHLNVNWKLLTSRMPINTIQMNDVINSILFLLNQKSVTGTDLLIDGGYTLR